MTVHNFQQSLERSHRYADAPWWLEVYREAFPDLESAVCVRNDGWAQRGGIDRVITLTSGKTLAIDEKVREKQWNDILLEYWSDEGRKIPGWVAKDLACDYLAYAFVPSATCYLLPFQTLRRAWREHRVEWVKRYKEVRANNNNYVTVSVAIPIPVLMATLSVAMKIKWKVAA